MPPFVGSMTEIVECFVGIMVVIKEDLTIC